MATWKLDERTRYCWIGQSNERIPLGVGTAKALSPDVISQEFRVGGRTLWLRWRLVEEYVNVTLSFEGDGGDIQAVSLPGSFLPEQEKLTLALPVMQGVLFDGRGEPFVKTLRHAGHENLSMAMLGYLSGRGGLLVTVEDYCDWRGRVGKRRDGSVFAVVEQEASLGAMRYARQVRLYPVDADLTSLCKCYRRRVRQRGDWKSWDEKISERPAVERLFGAMMAFIGYNQSNIDYVAQCRELQQMGFDRVFVYPVRHNTYRTDWKMGGDDPICLSDSQISAIKQLGFDVAPWTWVEQAMDDGAEATRKGFRYDKSGEPIAAWRIDEFQWYRCCTPHQEQFVMDAYAGPMKEMTWTHYDVNAAAGPKECYALDHPSHVGEALDRSGDLQFLRRLLGSGTNGNRIVSSEGFLDTLACSYDIGTSKMLPAFGDSACWTVPMTMLVYHDSLLHDWWELHNYNAHGGRFECTSVFGCRTEGFARQKAAMDALYGSPPNVFPFGRQYRWVDRAAHTTDSFSVRLEDPPVREAIGLALPVTRLHRKIGKLEMLQHEFLSEDGAVQMTVFSDGTHVVANFARQVRQVEGVGQMEPLSWKVRE